jgi:hypothetical protein
VTTNGIGGGFCFKLSMSAGIIRRKYFKILSPLMRWALDQLFL